jgi:hypothetical protein
MPKVIDFTPKSSVDEAYCLFCGWEGTKRHSKEDEGPWDCDECGSTDSVILGGGDDSIIVCGQCGSAIFHITSQGVICANCGAIMNMIEVEYGSIHSENGDASGACDDSISPVRLVVSGGDGDGEGGSRPSEAR